MRLIQILVILFLCLNFSLQAQPSLDTKVTLKMKATQGEILKTITEKYGIRFSYSNNMVSLDKSVSLNVQGKSLKEVLDLLFTDNNVNYTVVGNQIVLKKKPVKKSPDATSDIRKGATSFVVVENANSIVINTVTTDRVEDLSEDNPDDDNTEEESSENLVETLLVSSDSSVKAPVLKAKKPQGDDVVSLRKQYLLEKRRLRDEYLSKLDSMNASGNKETKNNFKSSFKTISQKLREELYEIADSIENKTSVGLWKRTPEGDNVSDSLSVNKVQQQPDTASYRTVPLAVSFVPPISSNGIHAGDVVNKGSLNILAGTSRGTDGFEVGVLVNVDKDFVDGVQISGFTNVVGKRVKGAQIAGFSNTNGGYAEGVQISGFVNTVKDSMYCVQVAGFANTSGGNSLGGQFSGFANVSNGYMYGPQCAGFSNVANGMITGPQLAGFINVANGSQKGVQAAGFMNVAKYKSEGFQAAGFMNTTGNLRGAQASGFINIAKKVRGAQIGIINIADTVDGVQIGLINIARKGYRRVELWGSEALHGNIAFKMGGSRAFYTIFALGAQINDGSIRSGYGLGVGTEWKAGETIVLNLDAIAFHINENGFWTNKLNSLNQLRLNVGIALGERTTLFFGPSFNVMVSQLYDADKDQYGSNIAPWTVFDETYESRVEKGRKENTNVKMWPGFNVGLRF
jgi:hypothetical protein